MKDFTSFLAESRGNLSFLPAGIVRYLSKNFDNYGPNSKVIPLGSYPSYDDARKKCGGYFPFSFVVVKRFNYEWVVYIFFDEGETDGDMSFDLSGREKDERDGHDISGAHEIFTKPGEAWIIGSDEGKAEKVHARYYNNKKAPNDMVNQKGKGLVRNEYYRMMYDAKLEKIQQLFDQKTRFADAKDAYGNISHFSDRIQRIAVMASSAMKLANNLKFSPPSVSRDHTLDELIMMDKFIKEFEKL